VAQRLARYCVGKSNKEALAVARSATLRGVESAWVKDQNILIEDGNITGYKVNIEVTFVLED
jgi:flavin-binding protein dodecin